MRTLPNSDLTVFFATAGFVVGSCKAVTRRPLLKRVSAVVIEASFLGMELAAALATRHVARTLMTREWRAQP
jgi:hypothetical protein